jgi:zinc transporter ZupT
VDGFLIGVSVAISPKAGIVLAFANCFEMSFLGMAYASRLVKCTGTSALTRGVALYGPPMLMFFAAGERDRGIEGQRDRGIEGQRDRGTEG